MAKAGLMCQYSSEALDQVYAMEKAIELAQMENTAVYKQKRDALLKDKIDVSEFMLWFVENYPKSIEDMKQRRVTWDQFR